jgi:hypothetical protein
LIIRPVSTSGRSEPFFRTVSAAFGVEVPLVAHDHALHVARELEPGASEGLLYGSLPLEHLPEVLADLLYVLAPVHVVGCADEGARGDVPVHGPELLDRGEFRVTEPVAGPAPALT